MNILKKNNKTELSALKGKMREEKVTYRMLSKDVEMSLNALNAKLNGYTSFTLDEAAKVIDRLGISSEEIVKYFFPSLLQNATMNKQYRNCTL